MRYRFTAIVLGGAFAAALSAGCNRKTEESQATPPPTDTTARQTQGKGLGYPEPRFPSYLKPPSSIEEVMPYVRPLVRARRGLQGAGLGIIEKGETALFVVSTDAEDMIVNAVVKGMEERGAKVVVKRDYELAGIPQEEAIAYRKARRTYTSEQGYMEAANWVDANFPKPEKAKAWLKQRRPDLYDKTVPGEPRDVTAPAGDLREDARGERRPLDPRVPREEPEDPRRVLGQGGQHQSAPLHASGRGEVPRPLPRGQPVGRHGAARYLSR